MASSFLLPNYNMMGDHDIHGMEGLRGAPTESEDVEDDFEDEEDFEPLAASVTDFDHQDHVKSQFEKDLEDARRLFPKKPETKEEKKQGMAFVVARTPQWHRRTWEDQNFLHYLAYYDYNRKPNLSWLMTRAIYKSPDLMGVLDDTKRTPLTAALSVGNEMFTHAACINQKPETMSQLTEALRSECANHNNDRKTTTCLHTALTSSFTNFSKGKARGAIIKRMCDFVPEEMFTVEDFEGRTPLHLAVEYERCCKDQVGIVNELLRRGQQALMVAITRPSFSKRPLSVYQYHEKSRRRAEGNTKPPAGLPKKHAQGALSQAKDRQTGPPDAKAEGKKGASRIEKGSMGPPPLPNDKAYGAGFGIQRRDSMPSANLKGTETPRSNDLKSKVPGPAGFPEASARPPTDRDLQNEEREKAAQQIGEQLKLHYLRTQRPDRVVQFLHDPEERDARQLWFDFGEPRKFTERDFEKQFRHLKFDSALQYVAFPRVQLEENEDISDSRHKGRKVIVDDLEAPSHSDEAIEDALKSFDVEILDWRRLDLDPVTLVRVGKCLREIHLQWGGGNPVLRAWSEKEGLAMIPTLETIHLSQDEGLESDTRTRENLDEFEKRLYEAWPTERPKPRVIRPKSTGGRRPNGAHQFSIPLNPNQERSVDPHKWMQCMEEFASYFRQIQVLRKPRSGESPAPVQVALIDDGTDITHPDLRGFEFPGQSFHHYRDGSTWRVSPYWDSKSGHGTLMARLILRVCPSATIHVIKLQTFHGQGSNKLQIRPESAIQAVKYAAELEVHIICTSWTMKPPTEDAVKKGFDDVIHDALSNKGILMFCAASDQGKSADLTYPHSSHNKSFRIGAAKATGAIVNNVGDTHELNYIFPGHEVAIGDVYGVKGPELEGHSGSSVANALAVGLAALIIECVRLGVFHTDETKPTDPTVAIYKEDLEKIRERGQMDLALASIGTNRNTENKYIEVWHIFGRAAERLKHNVDQTSQLEVIAGLARHFLRKGVLM
ncbi:hypothetical protein GCG54_00015272 [Colletotrichum gloeosporioides]|uniref:Peptidase S8/S53 domain-containing protein n=1 Tax=Colletotrichum gloeosporioides TaxID=474922 RepID=A0A8H4FDX4_COLGL|nr:uncharacterized protein GCG54_00015272 [Colletotrichum gloeosporioides]KAF3798291.1 hypothetical protein GCG54_00015272 [Colletotrichum gloeosporioides]